jgi:polyhydroxybutyrate depolymerase
MRLRPNLANRWLGTAVLFGGLALVRCGGNEHADILATPSIASGPTPEAGSAPMTGSGASAIATAGASVSGPLLSGGTGGRGDFGGAGGDNESGRGGTSGGSGAGSAGRANAGGGENVAGRTATGGAGASSAAICSGKPGALRGKSDQTLMAGGMERTFVYYAPAKLDPNVPAPIVIVPHGWLMSGQQMFDITQYHAIADSEGFILMYPNGQPGQLGPWNVGDGACPSTLAVLPLAAGDDMAFIDGMIAFAEADQCVDRKHVFVSGFSMGGYFSNETGCLRADIAAIGPHSGGSHELDGCPTKRKPAIIFHGELDGLIPAACGKEARDRWVEQNGCSKEVESVDVLGGHCEYSKACPADGQVVLCLFDGMDHGWAGGTGSFGFPEYESASKLGWEFFKKYAW